MAINQKGLDFYARLLDALNAASIELLVCLYHWDLPQPATANLCKGLVCTQALQIKFGGWPSDEIVPVFANYAKVVFEALGEKAVYWSTFNEPSTFCCLGYSIGIHAPFITNLTQAWTCVYNVLRSHAAAVKEFRAAVPRVKMGMSLLCEWAQPLTNSTADANPSTWGNFPESVKQRINYLPKIVPQLAADLNNSVDFFALNFYTSKYVTADEGGMGQWGRCDWSESQTNMMGKPLGGQTDSGWLILTPWAFRLILNWVNNMHHPEDIVETENGMDVKGEDAMPLPLALNDTVRIDNFKQYISAASDAVIIDKVPMTGYFAWSLIDNFEYGAGYTQRFGVAHVDYKMQQRTFKASAMYLAGLFNSSLANVSLTYPAVA
ncbi:g7633 [Coccomyxa elongata]